MSILYACVVILFATCAVHSARILGIFHMPGYSHYQLGDRIFRELAARGHEVTVITPFELNEPVKNLKHVVLTGFREQVEETTPDTFNSANRSALGKIIGYEKLGYHLTETVLNHTNVRGLLKSNQKFDLVIHELFVNEAFAGFADYYKAPSVIISTQGASFWTNTIMGNSHNPSYIPDYSLGYTINMNLFQRTLNTLVYIVSDLIKHFVTIPNQNKLLQKYFPGSPHLSELHYNTSLMLLNSNVGTHNAVPLLPNMIEIGGYHIKEPKTLPKDLKDYLDGAPNGVIFFSMGSNIKSKHIPVQTRNEIMKVFGQLKQNILWKWEDDVLPGRLSNVKLAKWFPQNDILAHPNVKLFITHGGMLSISEAIYHGVPILGLPVFGDQELNIANAEYDGYGIGVSFKRVNEATLSAAINKILNNPKYTDNVRQRSKIMHDRLVKPLDTAVYWIEYVLRHRGASHLKTASLRLKWYQLLLLDVAAVFVLSATATSWMLFKLVKLVCGKKSKDNNKQKKH